MKATGKYVVVKIPAEITVTKAGIHLPKTATQDVYYRHGTVESLGPHVTCGVQVGDRVMFRFFAFLHEVACLAVVHEDQILAQPTEAEVDQMEMKFLENEPQIEVAHSLPPQPQLMR